MIDAPTSSTQPARKRRRKRKPKPARPVMSEPARDLFAALHRDAMHLVDACNESASNATRGETAFLRVNLKSCMALAERLQRRAKEARQTLTTGERRHR